MLVEKGSDRVDWGDGFTGRVYLVMGVQFHAESLRASKWVWVNPEFSKPRTAFTDYGRLHKLFQSRVDSLAWACLALVTVDSFQRFTPVAGGVSGSVSVDLVKSWWNPLLNLNRIPDPRNQAELLADATAAAVCKMIDHERRQPGAASAARPDDGPDPFTMDPPAPAPAPADTRPTIRAWKAEMLSRPRPELWRKVRCGQCRHDFQAVLPATCPVCKSPSIINLN